MAILAAAAKAFVLFGILVSFASPANALLNGGNAVFMEDAPLETSLAAFEVELPPTGTTFFFSFWYNLNQRPTAGMEIYSAADSNGNKLITVGFVGDPASPYLEVDAVDASGLCAHLSTEDVVTMPFDGYWHNVILQLFVVPVAGSNYMRAQIAVDGQINEMNGSVAQGTIGGAAGYAFNNWAWSKASTWVVGNGFLGELAEWYLDLEGEFVPATLTTLVVSQFIDVSSPTASARNGSAPGLNPGGENACTIPSGIEPTMCHRGGPCNFVYGPTNPFTDEVSYVLLPLGITIVNEAGRQVTAFVLSNTNTEPCKFTNDGAGTDGYVPGTGCPQMPHPAP